MKLASIIIPVKNGMPFIKTSIDSVLQQSYTNLELVISDDHSTDGTSSYLESLKDKRVRVVRPVTPLNVAEHWTFATKHARGAYVKLLCADDLLTKDSLEIAIRLIESRQKTVAIYGARSIISENGHKILTIPIHPSLKGDVDGRKVIKTCIKKGRNLVGEPANLLFRAEYLLENMPWKGEIPYLLDLATFDQVFQHGNVIGVEEELSMFRLNSNSISSKNVSTANEQFKVFAKQIWARDYSNEKFPLLCVPYSKLHSQIRRLIVAISMVIDSLKISRT